MELPHFVESLFSVSALKSRLGARPRSRSGTRSAPDPFNPWRVKKQDPAAKAERTCVVCRSSGPKPEAYRVTSPSARDETLLIRRCPDCRSYFYDPIDLAAYEAEDLLALQDFYVESVGAPRFICQLLHRLPRRQSPRLLEIGSGYGLLLDVWQTQFGGTAVGVEPSPLSEAGGRDLGVNILRQYLKPGLTLPGGEEGYDHVVAMEIIEHVDDPMAFIKTAVSYLSERGILVLTTPNATLLDDARTAPHDLWSCLSPGKHTHIFNEDSLGNLLRLAGLTQIVFHSSPAQIVCYAGRRPFTLQEDVAPGPETLHEQYLRQRTQSSARESALKRGMAQRLFETLVHRGDFAGAVEVWQHELEPALVGAFGPEVLDHKEQWQRLKPCRAIADLLGMLPTFIAPMEHLRGMVALLHDGDRKQARRHFHQAHRLAVRLVATDDGVYPLVAPLVWQARFEEANTLLAESGDRLQMGLDVMAKIAASSRARHKEYARVPAPATLCTRAHVERLKAFVLRQDWKAARSEREAVRKTCAQLALPLPAGPGELAAMIEARGLAAAVPSEPLWYLYCGGMLGTSAPERWTSGVDYFQQLGRLCEHLEGQTPTAAVFRQESLYREAELCEQLGLMARAEELYTRLAALDPGKRPALERAEHWSAQARERLDRIEQLRREQAHLNLSRHSLLPVSLTHQVRLVPMEDAHIQIEFTWSDEQQFGMSGFVLVKSGSPEEVELVYEGGTLLDLQWHDRPDVYAHEIFAGYAKHLRCGFRARYQRRASHPIAVRRRSAGGTSEFTTTRLSATGFPPLPRTEPEGLSLFEFAERVNRECRTVLEIGSRMVCPGGLNKRTLFRPPVQYTGFDYYPDANTDVTGDAHQLSGHFPPGTTFDAIFSVSVLEHITMPWLLAMEINKMLPVGGLAFHSTLFTWALHEAPWDFWRFTHEGLRALFSPALGFEVIQLGLSQPCRVHIDTADEHSGHSPVHPTFAESNILVRKVRDINLDDFRWNATLEQVLPESSFYPAPQDKTPSPPPA